MTTILPSTILIVDDSDDANDGQQASRPTPFK
jgi:hypothetical protein